MAREQKTKCQSRSLTWSGLSKQLRNQIVCCFRDMTVAPKHLSSANGFTTASLPSLVLPSLLLLISPSSPLLTSTLCSLRVTPHSCPSMPFRSPPPSSPSLSSLLSFLYFSHLLFLSLPTFPSKDAFIILSKSVRYTTHTLSFSFPSAQAPFDLSKCSHRTPID